MRAILFISGCLFGGAASALASNQDGLYGSAEMGQRAVQGEASVASHLSDKASALAAQEKSLTARSADLEAEKSRVLEDIERNDVIRMEIRDLVQQLDERHGDQVQSQVKVYEKMRGTQAAAVLAQTDIEVALPIIQGMRPDKSARVLGAMEPSRAARITERLNAHPLAGAELP